MQKAINWNKMLVPDKITGELREWGEIFYLTFKDWQHNIKGVIKEKFENVILGLKNLYHDGTLFKDLLTV
jgi:hypothetical protein